MADQQMEPLMKMITLKIGKREFTLARTPEHYYILETILDSEGESALAEVLSGFDAPPHEPKPQPQPWRNVQQRITQAIMQEIKAD